MRNAERGQWSPPAKSADSSAAKTMFDGSAVEKRSVNLGGRRRDNASASELARRARVERARARRGETTQERPNTPEVVPRPARS